MISRFSPIRNFNFLKFHFLAWCFLGCGTFFCCIKTGKYGTNHFEWNYVK